MKIIECIPNFSEGKDENKLRLIVEAASRVEGVEIIDFSMDTDHNRSVVTLIGTPQSAKQGALALCGKALELIDMRTHIGEHPRIGAVDVVPFVPLEDASMEDAVRTAHEFGYTFAEKYDVPVYFYEEAALRPERKNLPAIRRGQYENLKGKITDPEWIPDAGPAVFNPATGATAVSARNPLIAFNINLDTSDIEIAKDIAKKIRQSNGGLDCVRAIGVMLKSRNIAQVSMNLINYKITSIRKVFDEVSKRAKQSGVDVLESELIGLLPGDALCDTTPEYLKLRDFCEARILEMHCHKQAKSK